MLLWTLACIYLFRLVLLFSSGKNPEVKLLDHMVVLCLIFWGNSTLFSIVSAWIYFPTKSTKAFPLLLILDNTCYLLMIAFQQVWGGFSLWFSFAFPWWLAMLSIFSCVCWSSICLLWKNVCLALLPIFKSNYFGFYWFWVVWVIYIFWILNSYWICHLQIAYPIQ